MNSGEIYRKFAQYYDLYIDGFVADLPLYRSICTSAHNVLEIGCGTGRVLKHLLEAGNAVVGVDISDEMLDVARKTLMEYLQNGTLQLQKHDFRYASFAQQYDRVLVTFYTFNYLLTETDQSRFLLNVRKTLKPDGILVMDLFYPQPLAQPGAASCWKESVLQGNGCSVILKQKRQMLGQVEERTQIYTEGFQREEIITERLYVSKQEVEALLESVGFSNIRFADSYDLSELQPLGTDEFTDSAFICVANGSD